MESKDYVVIQGWMVSELGLKGNELLVYALIYGYGRNGSYFTGSNQYIADWFGLTKRTIISVMNELESKNLISKTTIDFGGYTLNRYVADFTPGEKISPPSEKISPNNNSNNNIKEKDILHISKEKFEIPTLDDVNEYIKTNSYHFNAEDFINHYESVGWMIGNKKMKSWQACCRTWESNWLKKNPLQNSNCNYGRKI